MISDTEEVTFVGQMLAKSNGRWFNLGLRAPSFLGVHLESMPASPILLPLMSGEAIKGIAAK